MVKITKVVCRFEKLINLAILGLASTLTIGVLKTDDLFIEFTNKYCLWDKMHDKIQDRHKIIKLTSQLLILKARHIFF